VERMEGFSLLASMAYTKDFSLALPLVTSLVRIKIKVLHQPFDYLLPKILIIYKKVEHHKDYYYHNIPHPWLRVKIFQFLLLHPKEKLRPFYTDISGILKDVFEEAQVVVAKLSEYDSSALNSVFAVAFEAAKLVLHLPSLNLRQNMTDILLKLNKKLPPGATGIKLLLTNLLASL